MGSLISLNNNLLNATQTISGLPLSDIPLDLIKNKIFNQYDFKNIAAGMPAFFRHIKTLTQYGISEAQKLFAHKHFHNVTHTGLVLNSTDDRICIAEAVAEGVETNCYSKDELVKEEMCFAAPSTRANLSVLAEILGREKQRKVPYNFYGAIQQPLTPKFFTLEQRKELVKESLRHLLGWERSAEKEYFCSELVAEVLQISHLLSAFEEVVETARKELHFYRYVSEKEQDTALRKFVDKIYVESLWRQMEENLLFSSPASAIAPADLFSTFLKTGSLTCVPSQDETASPCDSNHAHKETDCLEYLAVQNPERYRQNKKISIQDPDIQKLIGELSRLTGYSKETLNCIFTESQLDLKQTIEKCLTETLTYNEKIWVYLTSQALKAGIERLANNPELLNQLLQPETPEEMEAAAKAIFPVNPIYSLHFIPNIYILLSLQNTNRELLSKYLILSILYHPEILKKAEKLGFNQIYRILENFSSIDREIIRCIHQCASASDLPACASLCVKPEIHEATLMAENVRHEFEAILREPKEWIQKFFGECSLTSATTCFHLDQPLESEKIGQRVNPRLLLPFAIFIYAKNDPAAASQNLKKFLSYENVLAMIKESTKSESLSEDIIFHSLQTLLPYNKNVLKCIFESCGFPFSLQDIQRCSDLCLKPNLNAQEKQELSALKDRFDAVIRKDSAPSKLSRNIRFIMGNLKPQSLLLRNLPLIARENPAALDRVFASMKDAWEDTPFEEKLILLCQMAYPRGHEMIQLINEQNLNWIRQAYYLKHKLIDGLPDD